MNLSGHKLIYADEFNTLTLSSGNAAGWDTTYHYGDRFLGSEQQVYVDPAYKGYGLNPFKVQNGILTITAQKAPKGFEAPPNFGHVAADTYVSGLLNSEASFSTQYGYFEIRAKMPAGQGLWPALWLLQSNGQWPAEYDIVEVLGHDTKTLHATSHWTGAAGAHLQEHKGVNMFDAADGFHTYGFDWTKDKITWYFDGVKAFEAPNRVTDQAMYLLLNLAVGGGWPGKPGATTPFPAQMQIDYVRVYQAAVDHKVVGQPQNWKAIGLSAFSMLNESAVANIDWKTARATWDYKVTMEAQFTAIKMMNDWAHQVTGNARDNYIEGAAGKYNELDGAKGNDVYKGGAGLDVFVVRNGDGNDRVLDFTDKAGNTDKLKLDGFHFSHFDDLAPYLTQLSQGVLLRLDEDQAVFLDKLKIADLKPQQFIFTNVVAPPKDAPVVSDPKPSAQSGASRKVSAETLTQASKAGSAAIDHLTYSGKTHLALARMVENVVATARGVDVDGNSLGNQIKATGAGHHTLRGLGGNDTLVGGDGGNVLSGGAGADRLQGGKGRDELWGGSGSDVFVFSKGEISKKTHIDGIGDMTGVGRSGGDRLEFEGFKNGNLRFSGFFGADEAKGSAHDKTKQVYDIYDGRTYEGTIHVDGDSKAHLSADDFRFL